MDDNALTCKQLVETITDYLEGKLSPAERAQFEQHLATCQGCTNYLAQMQKTLTLAGSLSAESLPPDSKQALLTLFKGWKQS